MEEVSDTTMVDTSTSDATLYDTTATDANIETVPDTTISERVASDTPLLDTGTAKEIEDLTTSPGLEMEEGSETTTADTTTTDASIETQSDTTITEIVASDTTFYDKTTAEETGSSTYDTSTSGHSSNTVLMSDPSTTIPRKCFCPKWACPQNVTTKNIENLILEMKQELKTPKKKTSRYIRSKSSATDNRPSAQAIGYFGVIIITCVVGAIIIVDLPNLRRHLQILKQRNKTRPFRPVRSSHKSGLTKSTRASSDVKTTQ